MSSYRFDGDGNRIGKTVDGSATNYAYDLNQPLPVVLDDGRYKYVWGLGLAYAIDTQNGNAVRVYHPDGLGSVRALTDSSGVILETYQTDAYGVPPQTQGAGSQPFQFARGFGSVPPFRDTARDLSYRGAEGSYAD